MDEKAQEKIEEILTQNYSLVNIPAVVRTILTELGELGYRRLPDKPPLIHADGCATNLGIIGAMCNCGAEAQREADIKHYEG